MGRGAGRRRLPDQHANRAARTSHFLTVLLMPRCLVKHSLHPVHGVFCTLSAYFSGVFLSECLWDAVSSQPSALGARAECGTALPDLPGAGPASSRMERTEEPSPWALPKNAAALGLSCHSLVLTAHSPCPAQVPRATRLLEDTRERWARGTSPVTLVLPFMGIRVAGKFCSFWTTCFRVLLRTPQGPDIPNEAKQDFDASTQDHRHTKINQYTRNGVHTKGLLTRHVHLSH